MSPGLTGMLLGLVAASGLILAVRYAPPFRAVRLVDRGVAADPAAGQAHERRVQRRRNGDAGDDCACVMELIDLGSGDAIRISQELGAGSSSCRVDPGGIAEAGSRLRASLEDKPDLVVVNKFGGLEKTGGGLADELLWAMAE